MPKYLVQGNYIGSGAKGLLNEGGSSRREAVTRLASSLGGTVESIYYAFGEADIYGILDMPDHVSMAAFSLKAASSGMVAVKTTVLMTPEEIDAVAKKSANYRAPGS